MSWSLQSIAAVVFTAPTPAPKSAFEVWQQLTGQAPSAFNQNPAGAPLGSHAAGPFNAFQLTVAIQPGRAEVALNPADPTPDAEGFPPVLDFASASAEVISLAKKCTSLDPPIRLAVVANFVEFVQEPEQAVSIFRQSTKLNALPPNAADLSFGLNVRRHCSTGWEMNRLCRWSVGHIQFVQFVMNAGQGVAEMPRMTISKHLAQLTVDLNTVPRAFPMNEAQAHTTLDELAAEVEAIMSGGYDRLAG